jgi:glutathione-specific gamma-glutamylcyclotransferase
VVTLISHPDYAPLAHADPHAPKAKDTYEVHKKDELVWGAAYHIPAQHAAEVTAYLDIREQNGYSVEYTTFYAASPSSSPLTTTNDATSDVTREVPKCLVYVGLPSNPQFVGPQDVQELAEWIVRSKGPSGENLEYLLNLEEALGGLRKDGERKVVDWHVSDLAERCRKIVTKGIGAVGGEIEGNGSGDVIEEVGR